MDIILGRGNANKLMARLLKEMSTDISFVLQSFDGGSLRNAIPREASAIIAVEESQIANVEQEVNDFLNTLRSEFGDIEPEISLSCDNTESKEKGMSFEYSSRILDAINASPNGVFAMSKDIEGLTETSTNLARVLAEDGKFVAMFLSRSSVESRKEALCASIESVFNLMAADSVEHHGAYPGWEPNPNSPILKSMREGYQRMYGVDPKVMAIHAGLECGILGTNYPEMDMISFGPTIRNPHSPDEMVNIASVSKFYDYLIDTLENMD